MKYIIAILVISFLTISSFSQSTEWKELHNFHQTMSMTFHPAEEDNLQPVKDSSTVLLAKAKAWQASAIPADYDSTVVKFTLNKLVQQCTDLDNAVKANKSDAELKRLITEAHETFHAAMEKGRKRAEQ